MSFDNGQRSGSGLVVSCGIVVFAFALSLMAFLQTFAPQAPRSVPASYTAAAQDPSCPGHTC
jgi:hypothetical protein